MIIEKLNYSYGDKIIYKDFDLVFDDHKITCILGPSGIGKTTLFKAIVDIESNNNTRIGYIYQEPRLIEQISVKQNLKFILNKNQYNEIDTLAKEFEIEDILDHMPKEISGGQASRVSIVRALLSNPELLLLDEPFKDLDIALTIRLLNKIKEYAKVHNITMICITHDVDQALLIADKVVIIDKNPAEIVLNEEIDVQNRELSSQELNFIRDKIYSVLLK